MDLITRAMQQLTADAEALRRALVIKKRHRVALVRLHPLMDGWT